MELDRSRSIQELVDNIVDLGEKKDDDNNKKLYNDNTTIDTEHRRFSAKDIFLFRIRNQNTLHTLSLYLSSLKKTNDVYTFFDLWYRNKNEENGRYEFVQSYPNESDLKRWFEGEPKFPYKENENEYVQSLSIIVGIAEEKALNKYNLPREHFSYVNLLKNKKNLMFNIFVLFITLQNFSSLSMYGHNANEYYYNNNAKYLKTALENCNICKNLILKELHILYKDEYKSSGMCHTVLLYKLLNIIKDNRESNSEIAYGIISCFLQTYNDIYFGAQDTNLEPTLDNDFYQHYVLKISQLTTTFLTRYSEYLKCKNDSCRTLVYPKDCLQTDDNKEKISIRRKIIKDLNEKRKKDVEKEEKDKLANEIAYTERQKQLRDRRVDDRRDRNNRDSPRERDSPRKTLGGSTKIVIYLVKIEKLRELNKKLRKNKTKNKNKIEKNNKQIDELKIKIKKQKQKEKLKKQKLKEIEHDKLKKQKEKLKKQKSKAKKVHITKKSKK
jgi:hypothetical protein